MLLIREALYTLLWDGDTLPRLGLFIVPLNTAENAKRRNDATHGMLCAVLRFCSVKFESSSNVGSTVR